MARPLALLLFVSSILASHAGDAQPRHPPLLTPAQLEQPAQVGAWLKQYASEANLARARIARDEGLEDAKRGDRGAAVKGFGESAIWFPSPEALIRYADAMEQFLGALRSQRKNRAQYIDSDLRRFEQLYRAAVASDDVLRTMSSAERREALKRAECIARYRKSRTWLATCEPLAMYGLRK